MCCQAVENVSFNIRFKLLPKENMFERAGRMTGIFHYCSASGKCKSFSEPLTVLASLFIMCSCICPSSNSNIETFFPDPERETIAKLQKVN